MPDLLTIVIERLDTMRSHLNNFRFNNDLSLLEMTLEELEETHDQIEDIIEEYED